MVKITYTGNKFTRRRLPSGQWISWRPNETIEVESRRLAEELQGNRQFLISQDSTPKVGGGVKTNVKTPKRRGRPPKSKVQQKVDKLKDKLKPKGLKKNKKAKKEKAD